LKLVLTSLVLTSLKKIFLQPCKSNQSRNNTSVSKKVVSVPYDGGGEMAMDERNKEIYKKKERKEL
jgi:hypothetical protein